ncbi:uncharacterized protein PRCAT00000684001 [Priceomyces carsonii]|uniref:uncharacterized protein n=1 Tax=Priceomyces carsonii TaxID=28549 RepID=UPI002ED798A1|nr:unnamed protein product [Priceomyces carsonii]
MPFRSKFWKRLRKVSSGMSIDDSATDSNSTDQSSVFDSAPNSPAVARFDESEYGTRKRTLANTVSPAPRPTSCYVTPPLPSMDVDIDSERANNVSGKLRNPILKRRLNYGLLPSDSDSNNKIFGRSLSLRSPARPSSVSRQKKNDSKLFRSPSMNLSRGKVSRFDNKKNDGEVSGLGIHYPAQNSSPRVSTSKIKSNSTPDVTRGLSTLSVDSQSRQPLITKNLVGNNSLITKAEDQGSSVPKERNLHPSILRNGSLSLSTSSLVSNTKSLRSKANTIKLVSSRNVDVTNMSTLCGSHTMLESGSLSLKHDSVYSVLRVTLSILDESLGIGIVEKDRNDMPTENSCGLETSSKNVVKQILKVKVYVGNDEDEVIALKVPKDRLKSPSDLSALVRYKLLTAQSTYIARELNLSIIFKDTNLNPVDLNNEDMSDLIMNFAMIKDKLYLRASSKQPV